MWTRRELALLGLAGFTELAFAQLAAVAGTATKDTVWLNANENPDGPSAAALEAMRAVLPHTGRYHYQEFRDFYRTLAASEGLEFYQILVGAGSSEVLQCAVHAFTGPDRPMIAMHPTYEAPMAVAEAANRKVISVPLTASHSADVKKLVEEAGKAGAGMIYLCNPNNPTGVVTSKADIEWLVANLPPGTIALIDEAYIHLADPAKIESALRFVKEGSNVVVTRSFSKLYGMAGMRAGFAAGPAPLIAKMAPFRNNVISIVTARGVMAALAEGQSLVTQRRSKNAAVRDGLCEWLRSKGVGYIESQTNFVMVEVKSDVRTFGGEMLARGVAVGRPFPPLDGFLRVSLGTEQDMQKFRGAFEEVYSKGA